LNRVLTGYLRRLTAQNAPSNSRPLTRGHAIWPRVLLCALALGLGESAGQTSWLEKVIYLPDSLSGVLWPTCIDVNPESHKVYVSSGYNATGRGGFDAYVVVLDSRTGEKLARVPVETGVYSLAYSPLTHKLYAARRGCTTVIDGASDEVVTVFASDPNRAELCCNTVNGKVYRKSDHCESLAVFDGSGDSVIARVYLPGEAHALTFDSLFNRLYCGYTDSGRHGLIVVDGDADTAVSDITTPYVVNYAVVSSRHRRLYSLGGVGGNPVLLIVDPEGDSVVGTVPTGSGNGPFVDDLRDELYFIGTGDTIMALDCAGDTVSRRLAVFPGREIVNVLGCFPERDRLICRLDNWVYLLDLATGDTLPGPHPSWTSGATYPLSPTEGRLLGFVESDDAAMILDVRTDSLIQTEVLVGCRPWDLCYAARADKIYVADATRGSGYTLDCASGRAKALLLPGPIVSNLIYDSLDNKIYCAASEKRLYAIDCESDSVVAVMPIGASPNVLCYNPLRNRLYSANCRPSCNLTVVDCGTDSVMASVRLGYNEAEHYALQYNPQRDELFCARHKYPSCEVQVLDCATNRIADTLPYCTSCIVYSPGLGKLYLTGSSNATTVVLDAATDTLLAAIPACYGSVASLNETDGKIYITDDFGCLVTVVDAVADSISAWIGMPGPGRPAHDVLNDKVYIPSGTQPGKVFVLDGRTDAILDSVPALGIEPANAIWNPEDGRVYVSNFYSGSISVFRDSVLPGTEEVVPVLRGHGSGTVMRQLSLPAGARWSDVYDISGRRVAQLGPRSDNAVRLGMGVYFVRGPETEDARLQVPVRKIIVVK
jgi:DNA-binding beta-propeller fold protein YncE